MIVGTREWLLVGDFNEIRSPVNKDGRGNFDQERTIDFNLELNNLIWLDAIGGFFTWSNGFVLNNTRKKLDRVLVTTNG